MASLRKFYQQNSNLGKHLPVIPEAEPRWGSPRQLHGLLCQSDVTQRLSLSLSHNDLNTPSNPLTTRASPDDPNKHQKQTNYHLFTQFFFNPHFLLKCWTVRVGQFLSKISEVEVWNVPV